MYEDWLIERCTIYRLEAPDFDSSNEGEFDENWMVLASNVPCLLSPFNNRLNRREDGWADSGNRTLYIGQTPKVKNGDRIAWSGDVTEDPEYFSVELSQVIRNYLFTYHHQEVQCNFIDWSFS